MNINLFDKIYEIMTEYENLLNYSDINKNSKNKTNDQDTFFKYIYDHIKISHTNINKNNSENMFDDNKISHTDMDKNNSENIFNHNKIPHTDMDKNNLENKYDESSKNQEDENKIIIDKFIKKIYKKIILKCHPDKNGDNNLFIKCQEYYEKNSLIGLIYIAYIINYSIPFIDNIIINQILLEIRIIQHNIDLLKEKYIIK